VKGLPAGAAVPDGSGRDPAGRILLSREGPGESVTVEMADPRPARLQVTP